jgi:hypothetical protein
MYKYTTCHECIYKLELICDNYANLYAETVGARTYLKNMFAPE